MTVKLKFTHQKFQESAASSVCGVFSGQPFRRNKYVYEHIGLLSSSEFTIWGNHEIEISDSDILAGIRNIQRDNGLPLSDSLEGKYNLTVEMETGTGKTYTYIKTIHELHRLYGWSKFIVVVPSIAVREGVYKTFTVTREHFMWDYGTQADCFIYNSSELARISSFVSDSGLQVMIINSQAFNARDADSQRIRMEIDGFGSRKPIDVIASVRPIMIIDEPQSVEGVKTRKALEDFAPLFTLRYSATPRERYNLVYRLDAMDAYNMKLVKRISVEGISLINTSASGGYVYLKGIVLSEKNPVAQIEFDIRGRKGIRRVTRNAHEGLDLFAESGGLEEYREGFRLRSIDGLKRCIEFTNGLILREGEISASGEEEQKRRIQIRETIEAHLEKEVQLFGRGIKVLSLFFIDEVAKYRLYDESGRAINGIYAKIFEEEYSAAVRNLQHRIGGKRYTEYLDGITAEKTHAGYFSVDKHNHMTDNVRKDGTTDDVSAYDLIMKDKERLLSLDEPVRFIFSHSALREGWDNPNVFQICALRNTKGEIRRRQEVGRGLRLCVDQNGERVDGTDIEVNELTVIANESYADFAAGLQQEIADSLGSRPKAVTPELFTAAGLKLSDYEMLIKQDYISGGIPTEKYYADRRNNALQVPQEIVKLLDEVFSPVSISVSDRRRARRITPDLDKLARPEFAELWEKINHHSVYAVDFEDDELVMKASSALNNELNVAQSAFMIVRGRIGAIPSKDALEARQAFTKYASRLQTAEGTGGNVRFDLAGSLAGITGLTRGVIVKILKSIEPLKLSMFRTNPEMFISLAARIIDEQKADAVVEHIRYNMLEDTYSVDIFTDIALAAEHDGILTHRLVKSVYDYIACDSQVEKSFAEDMDAYEDIAVYTKLPRAFFIETPVGRYNPDWAIAFVDGAVKHVYFVAETKGSMSQGQLRLIENAKIFCAREHFKACKVRFDVVSSFADLLKIIRG